MKIKAFILEDEPFGLDRLIKLLEEVNPDIQVLGHAETIKSAVWWFQNNANPDLIFMDIELADGQCFEIFKQVIIVTPIIFTTSYDEYALQAFKVNSIDYLLKPIRKDDLVQALAKYIQIRPLNNSLVNSEHIDRLINSLKTGFKQEYRQRFLVKQGQRWITIEGTKIAWFYAEAKLCFLRTWDNQRFVIDYTLEELENMLDPSYFFRLNRSYLVHANAIQSFQSHLNGKLAVHLTPKTDENYVLVSKEKAQEFKKWMGK